MPKSLRDVAPKTQHDLEKKMHHRAIEIYQGAEPDLPREGHAAAAHDHVADRLHDEFHKHAPGVDFRSIARNALKDHV